MRLKETGGSDDEVVQRCPKPRAAYRHDRSQEEAIAICDGVIDIFAALFNVPSKELRSPIRTSRTVAQVRQLAMYVAHVVLRLNMKDVGAGFLRDRTTVLHACHTIEDMRDDMEFDRLAALAERVIGAAFAEHLKD